MGQAEVQDEQIEGLGGQRGIGRKAVAHRVDRVAIVPERAGQAVCRILSSSAIRIRMGCC